VNPAAVAGRYSSARRRPSQLRPDDVVAGVDTHKDQHVAVLLDGGTAAFNDNSGSCSRASATSRCARSRSAFGYFLGAGMTPTLPWLHTLHETGDGSGSTLGRR